MAKTYENYCKNVYTYALIGFLNKTNRHVNHSYRQARLFMDIEELYHLENGKRQGIGSFILDVQTSVLLIGCEVPKSHTFLQA